MAAAKSKPKTTVPPPPKPKPAPKPTWEGAAEGGELEPGIHLGIPAEYYHGSGQGISRSMLLDFLASPAHYYGRYIDPERPPGQPWDKHKDDNIGALFHCLALEPGEVWSRYSVHEAMNRNTNAWKALVANDEAAGKVSIQVPQYEQALAMAKAVRKHPTLGSLLRRGDPEVSLYAHDPAHGLMLRCRFDWLHTIAEDSADVIALDLKSTGDANPEAFGRQAWRQGYAIQAAFYSRVARLLGLNLQAFAFGAVEDTWPHVGSATSFGAASIELAEQRVSEALAGIAQCTRTGKWPCYSSTGITVINAPNYAFIEAGEV